MPSIHLKLIGRWGNQLFQYAHARAQAERDGMELHVQPWPGKLLFQDCNDPEPTGSEDVILSGYFQKQEDLIYTRQDCLRWFKLKPEHPKAGCRGFKTIVGHRRVGDYIACGYPVVSVWSYFNAAEKWGIAKGYIELVSDELPDVHAEYEGELSFFPDFYRLMTAKWLLRGNSSFSWWAATLNPHQRILSPMIDGLRGGVEHDVDFTYGNWPRISSLDCCTNLLLAES